MKLLSAGFVGLTGLLITGLLALPAVSAADNDQVSGKREDDAPELVLVADEDDDDTNHNTTNGPTTNDNTNSRFTGVSRDRDLSRGDLTRDWTRDGTGDLTRDWSKNYTNDRSRNDTRH